MITILTGDNSFEIERTLAGITGKFDGVVEKVDGSVLQLNQLPDLLMGVSLFASARVVVMRGLSQNKLIWPTFGDWLDKISDDINLMLIEPKLDKRTATFKILKDLADIKEYQSLSDKDYRLAEGWVISEAKELGLNLDKKIIQFLVSRVGVDQWALYNALKKISLVDNISIDKIKDIIEPNPVENVFNLLDTALGGDAIEVKRSLAQLEQSDDPYRLFALLSTQVFQLAVVSAAEESDSAAKDFAIHPFVASKLRLLSKKIGVRKIAKIVDIFARADDGMKTSRADLWILIEEALLKVALT